ncbi:MAG: hypothetical protein AAF525_17225, partial [Pseudomonadota bacterium]
MLEFKRIDHFVQCIDCRRINRLIRDLWATTYKGNDIDAIQIVSGEDASSSRASRSYNYGIMMVKNGTQMDMKGRCSAGQRVLA